MMCGEQGAMRSIRPNEPWERDPEARDNTSQATDRRDEFPCVCGTHLGILFWGVFWPSLCPFPSPPFE